MAIFVPTHSPPGPVSTPHIGGSPCLESLSCHSPGHLIHVSHGLFSNSKYPRTLAPLFSGKYLGSGELEAKETGPLHDAGGRGLFDYHSETGDPG